MALGQFNLPPFAQLGPAMAYPNAAQQAAASLAQVANGSGMAQLGANPLVAATGFGGVPAGAFPGLSGAAQAAGSVAPAGVGGAAARAGGLAGRLRGLMPGAGAAAGAAGGRAGMLGMATRAAPWALGGYLGGQVVGNVFDNKGSSWDEAATGALTGAGVGAGIGSLIAPGVGTAIGGGLGGLVGGAIGMFGPKNTGENAVADELKTQQSRLTEVLNQFGASDELREQALLELQLGSLQATSKDQIKDIASQITSRLGAAIAQDKQTEEQERIRAANVAAVQAWTGPLMQQALNQQQFYANNAGASMQRAANTFNDPGMRASAQALASLTPLAASQQATGSLAQMASAPAILGAYPGVNSQGQLNSDLLSTYGAQQMPPGVSVIDMMLAQQQG